MVSFREPHKASSNGHVTIKPFGKPASYGSRSLCQRNWWKVCVMMLPSIHLERHIAAKTYAKAIARLMMRYPTAIDKLILTSPHGRDYYPQGDNAIVKAGAEHRIRMASLAAS